MATWCILNSVFHRLRASRQIFEGSMKAYLQNELARPLAVVDISQKYTPGSVQAWRRHLHTSSILPGARRPSGVQPVKRQPLKTLKAKKLPRVTCFNKMTIADLAKAMGKPVDHIYEVLFLIPDTEDYDHDEAVLDNQTIADVVKKSGMIPNFISQKVHEEKNLDVVPQPPPDPSVLVKRPPVVTIMGHVDHGKTTLLDKLRHSNIVEKEFGGITQHIGAFMVTLSSGESICFLDTPGHAAFSAMRARGAHITDIIVLVVAADDGVMHQTVESIQHAKDANVPIIVAINKIDKFNADVARTKHMLLEHEIQLEEFGGDTQAVPISALKGIGLQELQEAIITQSELMNLKGDPVGLVEGRVVESRVDSKRGRLATAIIQRGTVQKGQCLLSGTTWAKVKAIFDDNGKLLQKATPGTAVEIMGWKETPTAGDEIVQVKTESELKQALEWRLKQKMKQKQEEDYLVISEKRSEYDQQYREALYARRKSGFRRSKHFGPRPKESEEVSTDLKFSIVLKGDVDGSVEALLDTLDTYKSKLCKLDILHFGVGSVSETDVELAATFHGVIYAFNVDVPEKVFQLANIKKVTIKKHNIIYRLFNDLVDSINAILPKIQEDVIKGESKVLEVFRINLPNKKKAYVAGGRCISGSISKKLPIKVIRDDEVVYQGQIVSLKRFKEEADNIKTDEEFGLCVEDPDFVFKPQDLIVNYEVIDVKQYVDWTLGF